MRTFGELEVRGEARAETCFPVRTGVASVMPCRLCPARGSQPDGSVAAGLVAGQKIAEFVTTAARFRDSRLAAGVLARACFRNC
jgi:hypothetical protein